MTTRRSSFMESAGAVITPSGRWWRFQCPADMAACQVSSTSKSPRPAAGGVALALQVAGAPGDQSSAAPLLEDLLDLLVPFLQGLLGGHAVRRRIGEHRGQDEGVEDLALGRVGPSRVADVRRPLESGGNRLQLRRPVLGGGDGGRGAR